MAQPTVPNFTSLEGLDKDSPTVTVNTLDGRAAEEKDDWELDAIHNPRNWSFRKKWTFTAIVRLITLWIPASITHSSYKQVSFYTFVTPLGSSMMAPALPLIADHYHITNPTILAMTLSIFLLSFAIGPLFLAPLSEMYGRTWVQGLLGNNFLVVKT